MKNSLPSVTVIMPILNEAAFIQRSLGAVLVQDYPPEQLEILVVDGGSTDNTQTVVAKIVSRHPNVRILENPKRIQAAAMNIGIAAATGDIIIRVDGHTIIDKNYVSESVRVLAQGRAENVGGRMYSQGDTYIGWAIALATGSPFGIGGSKFHYSTDEQFVDTVYLGAYRRKTLQKIGLFDETFQINEDYELNYRLRKAGGKILLSPRVNSVYTPRSSLFALWRQYFRYGRWKVCTLKKHPASLRLRQAVAPLFLATLLGSFLLGMVWLPLYWIFYGVFGSYLLANLLASTITANRGGWRYFPMLPVVFASIHWLWGLGFWYGVIIAASGAIFFRGDDG